jgi:hypothetical protein
VGHAAVTETHLSWLQPMGFEKFLIYVLDVLGSNLDWYTGYPKVWWLSSVTH